MFWGTDGPVNLNWWLVHQGQCGYYKLELDKHMGTFYSHYWSCTIAQQEFSDFFNPFIFSCAEPSSMGLAHTLGTSEVGDVNWSHHKQKRVETKSSSFGGALSTQLLQGAAAFSCNDDDFKKQHPQLNFTRVLVLLMWMSGCLDWTTQGFRHRCTHCPMATQPSSGRNWVPSHQTTALLGSLGKSEPNWEVPNQARFGFDCQCLSAALPAYTNVSQVRWAQLMSPYGTWSCVDY